MMVAYLTKIVWIIVYIMAGALVCAEWMHQKSQLEYFIGYHDGWMDADKYWLSDEIRKDLGEELWID